MRPECETGAGQTETTSNSLCHSFERGLAVTTPVNWELLTSCCGGTSKESRRVWASLGFDSVEYYLVVDMSVVAVLSA